MAPLTICPAALAASPAASDPNAQARSMEPSGTRCSRKRRGRARGLVGGESFALLLLLGAPLLEEDASVTS